MEDQVAVVEKRIDELERELAELHGDLVSRMTRSFRWTLATIVVAALATWFGIFLFLSRGAAHLRQLLQ
jgi:hypothetical protein